MNSSDEASNRDGGFIALTTAIMMVGLLMAVAFAVDIARWYFEAERVQRTVDAAALAGAPYLPEFPSQAYQAARDVIDLNGFDGDSVPAANIQQVTGKPSQLSVKMSSTIDNYFAVVLGFESQTVTRTGVADFAPEVAMGSPCNVMGNEPPDASGVRVSSSLCPPTPNFWSIIALPDTQKVQGDQYASRKCATSGSDFADLCTSSKNDNYYGTSVVPKEPYYAYKFRTSTATSNLKVEIYDPMFINVGQECESNLPGSASDWTSKPNDYVTLADAKLRYVTGRTQFCNGDFEWNTSGSSTQKLTSYAVLGPTETRNPLSADAPVLCRPAPFGYFSGSLTNVLKKASGSYNDTVARNFRQWVTICNIPNPEVNKDYYIIARTNVTATDDIKNLAVDKGVGYAQNRYGIRISAASTAANASVSVSALKRMPIFATIPSGTTEFHLARVGSGNKDSDLLVTFFDTGDFASGSASIQIREPYEVGGTPAWRNISSCQAIGTVRGSLTSPQTLTNCILTPVSKASYQGQLQQLRIRVPSTYSCTDTNPAACWYKLYFTYPSGADVTDTTTWSAELKDDPVRLVK